MLRGVDGKAMNGLIPIPGQLERFIRLGGRTPTSPRSCASSGSRASSACFSASCSPASRSRARAPSACCATATSRLQEEAEDLVRSYETALKRRRRGHVIRLELEARDAGAPAEIRHRGARGRRGKRLRQGRPARARRHLAADRRRPARSAVQAVQHPLSRAHPRVQRRLLRRRAQEGHRRPPPYESFDVVVQYLRQAVADPNVMAIKWTLYRTSRDSPIVQALKEAVEAGKSVTAVVELKARFDEAANIRWARDLESAGVHVVYGFIELKTHAKLGLIVRREGTELVTLLPHRHRQLSSADGARLYRPVAVHHRSGDRPRRDAHPEFRHRLRRAGRARVHGGEPARHPPANHRHTSAKRSQHAKAGRPGGIWMKMNALVDAPDHLQRFTRRARPACRSTSSCAASAACARVFRDFPSNIRVKSIIGRFLEHARIYCFGRGAGVAFTQGRRLHQLGRHDAAQSRPSRRGHGADQEPDGARAGARSDHGRQPREITSRAGA